MCVGRSRIRPRSPRRIQRLLLLKYSPEIRNLTILSIHYTDFMNTTTSPAISDRSNKMGRLVAGALSLFVICIGLVLLGHLFPQYDGTEFSPISFRVREFQIRRWPPATVVQPASLACSMEISKHLTNATRTPGIERWDLIACSQGRQGIEQFEATVLIDALKVRDSTNDLFWEEWSKSHPSLAKILWPAVQQLAIHKSYFAIPGLLQHAASAPPAKDLANLIATISLRAGIDQSRRELAKRQFKDASVTVEWAKSLGGSPEFEALENSIRAGLLLLPENKK